MARTLLVLALALLLSGCTREPAEAVRGDPDPVTPPTPTAAAYQIDGPRFFAPDGTTRTLREDDGSALLRYTVKRVLADGPREAFLTLLLDGSVLETENIALSEGEERRYERTIPALSVGDEVRAEVRVGSAKASAKLHVLAWPRPGETLDLGEAGARLDGGLLTRESGRVRVSLTLARASDSTQLPALDVAMMCRTEGDALVTRASARAPLPTPGKTIGTTLDLHDCVNGEDRYGVAFTLTGRDGTTHGRILLTPRP